MGGGIDDEASSDAGGGKAKVRGDSKDGIVPVIQFILELGGSLDTRLVVVRIDDEVLLKIPKRSNATRKRGETRKHKWTV